MRAAEAARPDGLGHSRAETEEAVRLEIRSGQEPQERSIQFARQALQALNREHRANLEKIRARMETGFYSRPAFFRELAELLIRGPEQETTSIQGSSSEDATEASSIAKRLESGYYDRPEVRRALAERIWRHLRREPL
ncbi:MAG: hypothetical protein N2561_09625 [Bacteroidetes bacterium]|nr:hypothetical protein [Rhodothermia bacterium]MCS7156086.1 hypothetical protein [Bacteroidota bacterium]MCX7907774.1 hypothetical protein [Bacteroidota bacterium]MDW8137903.1 hypothetical protein [Bacteroidota bacterium]MDW8286246.1 hypothetical protein [Bacteroidota bacterium]